jgi:hypothetical protein
MMSKFSHMAPSVRMNKQARIGIIGVIIIVIIVLVVLAFFGIFGLNL